MMAIFCTFAVRPLAAIGIEPKFGMPKSAKVVDIIVATCFLGNFVADYFGMRYRETKISNLQEVKL